ncbi:hypothetical protein VTK73DRAFT_7415 [Phialemonium thermophilum]|uniref:Uncharacterized protein n=1 Tax=Phialemonium thermophilum TaxID=223376 RepID=A0ABR3XTP0_9PEZI
MSTKSSEEAGGESSQMNPEDFPSWTEPTLVSDQEIDEIVELRPRQPKGKPVMRVDAAELRESGLLKSLPEFIGQLARANLEMETQLANAGSERKDVGFELDDEEADGRPHIEMNVFTGLMESRKELELEDLKLPGAQTPSSSSTTSDSESDASAPAEQGPSPSSRKRKAPSQSPSTSSEETFLSSKKAKTRSPGRTRKRSQTLSVQQEGSQSCLNADVDSSSNSSTQSSSDSGSGLETGQISSESSSDSESTT